MIVLLSSPFNITGHVQNWRLLVCSNVIPSIKQINPIIKDHVKITMYQRKVDVDIYNAVKSVLADVSSVSPWWEQSLCSDESERSKRQPTHSLRCSAYPHQPYVDTLYVLPPRRRRPKLVLTGTSIPLCHVKIRNTVLASFRVWP